MKNYAIDELDFKLEKLFLTADGYSAISNQDNCCKLFCALTAEIEQLQHIYNNLEIPLLEQPRPAQRKEIG